MVSCISVFQVNFKILGVEIMSTEGMRFMKVGEVADILNISKSLAYEYMQGADCPFTVLKINSRYVVPYNSFCAWYESLGDNGGERRHK